MDICTFWLGNKLRAVDIVCLSSMVLTGHRVKLFTYAPIENVPDGVELHDAASVMPLSVLYQLDPDYPSFGSNVSVVQFSDLFRVMLMKHRQGVWLDTDVYLVRPFLPSPDKVWLARENRERVGVSALYLPPDNPIIGAFEDYLRKGKPIPPWLGCKRRCLRPWLLRLQGKPVRPNRLGITVFGNDGISRLAKQFDFFKEAQPKETFYYWTGREAARIFDPAFGLEPMASPCFIGFHIHAKTLSGTLPPEGSFYDWALQRLPAKAREGLFR